MASDLSSDLNEFQAFVQDRLDESEDLTLEESLDRFRKYQRELESAREKLREAENQSVSGLSSQLDAEAVKREVRKRLATEGITD